jgi:O-antigen/teichoic acid export membrane protein
MALTATKTKFLLGVGVGYLELLVRMILAFIMTPVILHYLGRTGYGIWATLGSLVGYFGIVDVGMNLATAKFVAEYRTLGQKPDLNKLASTILVIFGIAGAAILLIFIASNSLLPTLFGLSPEWALVARLAFVIMGLNLGCGLVTSLFVNIIFGHERVDMVKIFTTLQALVTNLLILIFLYLGYGLIGVAAAATLGWVVLMALCIIYIRRQYNLSVHLNFFDLGLLKEIAPFSLRSLVLALSGQILYRTDNLVIGVMLGVMMVAPYEIGYKLCYFTVILTYKISETLFPQLCNLYAASDMEGLRRLHLRIASISITLMTIFCLFLFSCGREVLALWVGPDNVLTPEVFGVLVLLNLTHAVAGPAGMILQAIGKNRWFTLSSLADAALNLGLSIILCRQMGILGVALGTLTAHLLTDSWAVSWLACKYIGLPVKKYLLSGILPPLMAAMPMAIILFFLPPLSPATLVSLALKGSIICVVYLCFCFAAWEIFVRLKLIPAFRFSWRSLVDMDS